MAENRSQMKFVLFIVISIIISDITALNINDRVNYHFEDNPDASNKTKIFIPIDVEKDFHCVAVEAISEAGCIIQSRIDHADGLDENICQKHRLCLACGPLLGLRSWYCSQKTHFRMRQSCLDKFADESKRKMCLDDRYRIVKVLNQKTYRPDINDPEIAYECRKKCVYDYLRSD